MRLTGWKSKPAASSMPGVVKETNWVTQYPFHGHTHEISNVLFLSLSTAPREVDGEGLLGF